MNFVVYNCVYMYLELEVSKYYWHLIHLKVFKETQYELLFINQDNLIGL